jgi:nitroreductase
MDLKQIEELYLNRQSCRNYDASRKIDSVTLKKIAELSLLAPSACNSQPWKLYVANKQDVVTRTVKATQPLGVNKFTDNCTAFIVITETSAKYTERVGMVMTKRDFIGNDLGIVCSHIVLAAKSAGIDSCILGMFDEKQVKEIYGIPEKQSVRLIVALGYASETDVLREKKRKPQEETCEFILD